jgi:intraflagellar transport protein 46
METKLIGDANSSDELEDLVVSNQAAQQEQRTQNTLGSPNYRLSNEIKELFHYIEEFTAERIEVQAVLRPFFLDYIPAVGDVDPFLKIPRPDQVNLWI